MPKKQMKRIIFMGFGCGVLLIAGIIYSLLYNDGRWVKEMDLSNYVFSAKDVPMLAVGALITAYVIYIMVVLVKIAFSKKHKDKRYSRTISPYLGLCGIFGFLGFGGFWTYYEFGEIYPFVFLIFFGFFGFFFEGKHGVQSLCLFPFHLSTPWFFFLATIYCIALKKENKLWEQILYAT